MDLISPSRFIELKQKIKAECERRQYKDSVKQYSNLEYDFIENPTKDKIIFTEHYLKNFIPLNAINADKTPLQEAEHAIKEDELIQAEAQIIDYMDTPVDSESTDCKANSCAGLCYGDCQSACSTTCTGTCSGGCNTTCTGTCSNTCRGDCEGGCSGECSTTCTGKCYGCGDGCAGKTCTTTCTQDCSQNCRYTCSYDCGGNGCSGKCYGYCSGGCENNSTYAPA